MEENNVNKGFIILITIVAALGGFLFGFDSGVINGTVKGLETAFNSQDVGSGFNVASMLLGCAVGAFFAGSLADRFGRRAMLRLAALFFLVSAFGSGIATSSFEFIIYRILGGLAVGAASVMAPAYISEISPAKYRGALATTQQIAIILGLFTSFISNYILAKYSGSAENILWLDFETWRWMFWMEMLPALIFLVALFFIPETPRYLTAKDKEEEATSVLEKLYGKIAASQLLKDIRVSLSNDHSPSFKDLIDPLSKKVKIIVWVGIGLATFQQLVGINVVFYYGAVLWQAVGFEESDSLLINVVSGALSIVAVILSLLLVDRIGRKPILLIGSIGMTVTLATVAWAFASGVINSEDVLELPGNLGVVALVSANLYVVFFNFSWGPVMWVVLGEMFPNQMRGSGLAVAGLAQWISNFAITLTFPILLSSLGLSFAYSIYTFFALVSIFFVIRFVQETKGKSLEEMDAVYED